MRRHVLAAALVGALVLPTLAAAKGPVSASISGPGLDRSLAITGDGEGPGTALGTLTAASGFFAQVFGQSPDPMLDRPPGGDLGPRYTIIYVVPGPNSVASRVVQFFYPNATPVPLTYMKPGQTYWGTRKTQGGWYRASTALTQALVAAGLPVRGR